MIVFFLAFYLQVNDPLNGFEIVDIVFILAVVNCAAIQILLSLCGFYWCYCCCNWHLVVVKCYSLRLHGSSCCCFVFVFSFIWNYFSVDWLFNWEQFSRTQWRTLAICVWLHLAFLLEEYANQSDGFTCFIFDFAIFTILLLHSLSNFSRQLNASGSCWTIQSFTASSRGSEQLMDGANLAKCRQIPKTGNIFIIIIITNNFINMTCKCVNRSIYENFQNEFIFTNFTFPEKTLLSSNDWTGMKYKVQCFQN